MLVASPPTMLIMLELPVEPNTPTVSTFSFCINISEIWPSVSRACCSVASSGSVTDRVSCPHIVGGEELCTQLGSAIEADAQKRYNDKDDPALMFECKGQRTLIGMIEPVKRLILFSRLAAQHSGSAGRHQKSAPRADWPAGNMRW